MPLGSQAASAEWLGDGPNAAQTWDKTQAPTGRGARSGRRERLEKTYQIEALPPCREHWPSAPKFGSPGLALRGGPGPDARLGQLGQGTLPPVLSARPPVPSLTMPMAGALGSAGQAVSSAREMVSGNSYGLLPAPSQRSASCDAPRSAREPRAPQERPARRPPRRLCSPAPGILADRTEAKGSYNSIDPGVCEELHARLAALVREHEGVQLDQATGVYLILEHCHSCGVHHALTTRHDEQEYDNRAKALLAQLLRVASGVVLGAASLPCRLEATNKCLGTSHTLGQDIWHQASRVGAFEVYLLAPALRKEPVDQQAVLRLPRISSDLADQAPEDRAADRAAAAGAATWGAEAPLPGGHYTATLLHSKLCSNSWPKQDELIRRFLAVLPLGIATIRVLCPSGRPLSSFSVAVRQPGGDASSGGQVEGRGVGGSCRIEGVPLRTELELCVAHPTMATQTLRFMASSLRAEFTLGTDVVFNLWALEVPGGLVIYASDPEAHPSHIPEKATPFNGHVETDAGEKCRVRGSMRLPWSGFQIVQEGVLSDLFQASARGGPGVGGTGDLIVFGCNCSSATGHELPSLAQLRAWLPSEVAEPSAVLRRSPCRAVLQAVQSVLSVLQRLSSKGASVEEEQVSAFASLLDRGLKLLYTFTRASWERWQQIEELPPEPPRREVCKRILQDPVCQEIADLCGNFASAGLDPSALAEVERLEGGQQGQSRGRQLAGAYMRAWKMKPWLDKFCQAVAHGAAGNATQSSLKGSSSDCTRVFEKMTLRPEWGAPWDLLSCTVVCPSLDHVINAVRAAAEMLGEVDEAALLEVDDYFQCCEAPRAKQGSVRLYVAWKENGSAAPAVGEIQLVHQAFLDDGRVLAESAAGRARFFAELLERKRRCAPVQAEVEPVEMFATLRRLFVEGYHSTELELKARSYRASIFRQQECLEVAMLAAPTALVQVVAPGREAPPLSGVRVQVESELQHSETDESGCCQLLLRPGRHLLKLRHDELSSKGWVERELTVASLLPMFRIPMPVTLAVWRSPVTIRGEVCAWRVWLAPRPGGGADDEQELQEPFAGILRDGTGAHLHAEKGQVTVESGPVELLEAEPPEGDARAGTAAALLGAFTLDAPFARLAVQAQPAAPEELPEWRPRLLGCRPEGSLLPSAAAGAGALAARARTLCCGVGVAGVRLQAGRPRLQGSAEDPGSGSTDSTGVCVLQGLPPGTQAVQAMHPALDAGWERHEVCAASRDEPAELPLFFGARLQLFTVPGPSGRQVLRVAAGGKELSELDPNARPFVGRLVGEGDWQLRRQPPRNGGDMPPLEFPTAKLKRGGCCPVLPLLTARPDMPGYEWQPEPEAAAAAAGPCGLQQLLLRMGPLTLGTLRPVVDVLHIDGQQLRLPVEECPTVAALTERLREELRLAGAKMALASADERSGQALSPDLEVRGGQRLRVLARLQVRVTLGRSEIGIPGASLCLDEEEALKRGTSADGWCEILTGPGLHRLAVSHPLLGESPQLVDVETKELAHCLKIPLAVAVYVALRPPPSAAHPSEPSSVWLCALPGQLPEGVRPVEGELRVPAGSGSGSGLSAALDAHEIRLVTLQPAGEEGGPVPLSPVPGIDLQCRLGDCIWTPDAPLLLNSMGGWKELLMGPVRAGLLEPPVLVRCHGLVGEEGCLQRLPARAHGRARDVRAALAATLEPLAEEALGIFRDELLLDAEDHVAPWSSVDLWPVAPLIVRVQTQCCCKGVPGVNVRVCEDHLLSGRADIAKAMAEILHPGTSVVDGEGQQGTVQTKAVGGQVQVLYQDGTLTRHPCETLRPHDPRRAGATGTGGECCITANAGDHSVHLVHPLLAGCAKASGESLALAATTAPGEPLELAVRAEPLLYLYATVSSNGRDKAEGTASGEALRIWLCARAQDVPPEARPVRGALRLPAAAGEARVQFGGSAVEPWRLPEECFRGSESEEAPCPMRGMVLEPEEGEMLAWSPEELPSSAAACLHTVLAAGPLHIGALRPAVAIAVDSDLCAPRRKLPAADFASVGALRKHLAEELGKPAEDIAIFPQSDRTWGALPDDAALAPGQELFVGLIACLSLRVLVPEGTAGEGGWVPEPLPGVLVELDGVVCGETSTDGHCEIHMRAGQRCVRLLHAAFGPTGRLLQDVEVEYGRLNERVVLSDIRVYLYATDPEPEPEGEGEDEAGAAPGEPPLIDPSLVWACCSREQIPEEALGLVGRASGVGADGRELTWALAPEGGPAELVLLTGEQAEAGGDVASHCSLASFVVEVQRDGYCWRPKDPLPIKERAEELGGSEYLRLLACPMVIGYFDPALRVESASSPPIQLPVKDFATCAAVRDELESRLGIPAAEMVLFQAEEKLDDAAFMAPGMQLKAVEVATVALRTVTSCCGEPLTGVEVSLDGSAAGTTDSSGCRSLTMVVGDHSFTLDHPMLGQRGRAGRQVAVSRKEANELVFPLDPRLFIYATDPDEEEEEAENEDGDEYCPLYDPSCVWLAADPSHIPEDARPLEGCAACSCGSKSSPDGCARLLRARLSPDRIAAFEVGPGAIPEQPAAEQGGSDGCFLGSLSLRCGRESFVWAPKEPSPLAERLAELGGCELLRLAECPVALGFLKPAVTVHCAGGKRLVLPLDACGELQALRVRLAEELGAGEETAAFLQLEAVEASQPLPAKFFKGPAQLLCALPGESLATIRSAMTAASWAIAGAAAEEEPGDGGKAGAVCLEPEPEGAG